MNMINSLTATLLLTILPLAVVNAEDSNSCRVYGGSKSIGGMSSGYLTEVKGNSFIVRKNKRYRAEAGITVKEGDTIITTSPGKAQMEFHDGTIVQVGENSGLTVLQYNGNNKHVKRADIRLIEGWMRFKASELDEQFSEHFSIHLPTLTIGIRGTEGILHFSGGANQAKLTEGSVDVCETSKDGGIGYHVNLISGQFVQRSGYREMRKSNAAPDYFNASVKRHFKDQIKSKIQYIDPSSPVKPVRAITQKEINAAIAKIKEQKSRDAIYGIFSKDSFNGMVR